MIITEAFRHDGPGGPFAGIVARDDAWTTPRAAVMVAHAFGGQGAFEVERAQALAALSYVGVAIDVYGEGRRATSPAQAQAMMDELVADRPQLAARMHASLAATRALPSVDPSRVAAIGFCFGGKCVLDLARTGADVRAVVSFHGLYDAPSADATTPIAADVLLLHGWDDPLAPPDAFVAIARELTSRGARWQANAYGHTGHAFTNPRAQSPATGMWYREDIASEAWAAMVRFVSARLHVEPAR